MDPHINLDLPSDEESGSESLVCSECEEEIEDLNSEPGSCEDSASSDGLEEDLNAQSYELEKKVSLNPYDYDAHVELQRLLHSAGETVRLQWARERMSKHFTLSEELWLEWLGDETWRMKLPEKPVERICSLYERAVKDCYSVKIWLSYTRFCIVNLGRCNNVDTVRALFERALAVVGLHFTQGHKVWEAYRYFENIVAVLMSNTEEEAENSEMVVAQMKRIGNLFRRQLSHPLRDMKHTKREYEAWVQNGTEEGVTSVDDDVVVCYGRALVHASRMEPFETRLFSTSKFRMDVFREYLAIEKLCNDLEHGQCLYQRALMEVPHAAGLWLEYVQYLDVAVQIEAVVMPAMEHAVHSCPWSSPLWQYYIRVVERYDRPSKEAKDIVGQALTVGFSSPKQYLLLWQSYLDYLRRRLERGPAGDENPLAELQDMYRRACNYQQRCFGRNGDPSCSILRSWARVEAFCGQGMPVARTLWSEIMSMGHIHSANKWFEYITLERIYGNKSNVRQLFETALEVVSDRPKRIGNAWLHFEKDEGTLKSLERCESLCRARLLKGFEKPKPFRTGGRRLWKDRQNRGDNKTGEIKTQMPETVTPQGISPVPGCSGLTSQQAPLSREQRVPSIDEQLTGSSTSRDSSPSAPNVKDKHQRRLEWNQQQERSLRSYYSLEPGMTLRSLSNYILIRSRQQESAFQPATFRRPAPEPGSTNASSPFVEVNLDFDLANLTDGRMAEDIVLGLVRS